MNTTAQQTVLVTGASGFVGAHLVRRLVALGGRVSCLVRATSHVGELRAAGAELYTCDVNDRPGVSRAIASSRAAVVFHLAGLVRAMSPRDFMRVNAEGVEAVAAACTEQVAPPVLVLVSSLAAAGPSGEAPKTEIDPPLPVSVYGRSKLAGEQAAAQYAGALPITIVRSCVVFGAGDRGMFELFKPIARYGIHVVPGRGDWRVSLVAVADLIECLILAAEKGERLMPSISTRVGPGPGSGRKNGTASKSGESGLRGRGIYCVAAADLSYVDLGHAIASALGNTRARIVCVPGGLMRLMGHFGDVVSWIRRRPGWVGHDKVHDVLAGSWTCSSEKARLQLGWAPGAPLIDRLRETVLWYRNERWL